MNTNAPYLGRPVRLPCTHVAAGRTRAGFVSWFSLPMVLWSLLWLSINTGPWNIGEFGNGLRSNIDAVRAALPLLVCAIAFVSMGSGKRTTYRSWAEKGFWMYGLVMLLACTGAQDWFDQAYWGLAFLATLAVTETGLSGTKPFEFATRLNCLSWMITIAALVILLFLARDVLYDPRTNSAYGLITRFEGTNGYTISRETGLSRMATVPAIISLVFLFSGRSWHRLVSLVVFAASSYVIWIMQSRGALFSFAGAFLFVLLLGDRKGQKIAAGLVTLLLLGAYWNSPSAKGGPADLWMHVTRDTGIAGFSDMSGRYLIWQDALQQWSQRPWFGYGPQADRLFGFNAQNVIIYTLLCAGAVGAVFFVTAIASSWRALLSLISNLRRLPARERIMVEIAGGILVFSTFRSFPENQSGVFSVDLLLQYPAMIYLVTLARRHSRFSDVNRRRR